MYFHIQEVKRAMKDQASDIRILGISEFPVAMRDGQVVGKAGGLYNELNTDGFTLSAVYTPRITGLDRQWHRIRTFSFNIQAWRKNIALHPRAFDMRTDLVESYIEDQNGSFDMVFQMLALQTPGIHFKGRPYVVCTDNTFMLSRKLWPEWTPNLNEELQQQWLERENDLFQHAALLLPWGKHVAQSMIEDYGVDPARVVSVGMSGNLPVPPDEAVKAHDYTRQTALFVGYEFKRKGGFVLLEAWPKVREQLPNAQLIIAGPDKPQAAPLPGVQWFGSANAQQLQTLFLQATVFALPSYFEPWGHVFMEAMSYGVPCIGTNTCAMPEFIHNGETGYRVDLGDANTLADCLIATLGDADHAAAMGQNAHRLFNEQYTWDKVGARVREHLRHAVPHAFQD